MKATLSGFSVQDVLLLVGAHARTGELIMESGNNIGTVLFHKGKILHAFSPYSRAIGDLLVEEGLITEEELIETLQLQKKTAYMPLGGLLLKTGRVSLEVIESMVHEQIRQALREFTSWSNLTFSFSDKDMQPYDQIHLVVYEFVSPEALRSATQFLLALQNPQGQSSPAAV